MQETKAPSPRTVRPLIAAMKVSTSTTASTRCARPWSSGRGSAPEVP